MRFAGVHTDDCSLVLWFFCCCWITANAKRGMQSCVVQNELSAVQLNVDDKNLHSVWLLSNLMTVII